MHDDRLPMLSEVMPEFVGVLPNASMTHLVKRMKMTMKLYSGLGLAANQCAVKERVFVIGTDQFQMACINPKVIEVSEELVKDTEGCLSFPALSYETPRAFRAVAKGFNMFGEPITVEGTELLARCLQHESDHLDGIVFIDRLSAEDRKLAMKEIRESDWFSNAQASGLSPSIKTSPHNLFGKGL